MNIALKSLIHQMVRLLLLLQLNMRLLLRAQLYASVVELNCLEAGVCASFFFFFQAEDGIRDIGVTGVQTCALPISAIPSTPAGRSWLTPAVGWSGSSAATDAARAPSRAKRRPGPDASLSAARQT